MDREIRSMDDCEGCVSFNRKSRDRKCLILGNFLKYDEILEHGGMTCGSYMTKEDVEKEKKKELGSEILVCCGEPIEIYDINPVQSDFLDFEFKCRGDCGEVKSYCTLQHPEIFPLILEWINSHTIPF